MAKVVFFITDMQLEVLRRASTSKEIGHTYHRAFYTLRRKGLVDGSVWGNGNDPLKLTKIGARALAVVEAVEKKVGG